MDYYGIAKRYAERTNHHVALFCVAHKGFHYFWIRYSEDDWPRYTGHPLIIKISTSGRISLVTDLDVINWAVRCFKERMAAR